MCCKCCHVVTRRIAARRAECDVLLLVRGGGSLEDLWGFNELAVAEAIRECPLPIVSGVGHEVDVTIADLIADLRAPTPSAAAELSTPDGQALLKRAQLAEAALESGMARRLSRMKTQLAGLQARLEARHPRRLLLDRQQRIDELDTRLRAALQRRLENCRQSLANQQRYLLAHGPSRLIAPAQAQLNHLELRLQNASLKRVQDARHQFNVLARTLNSVSPLAVLDRGYALVSQDKKPVTSVAALKSGDPVITRLSDGTFDATVTRLNVNHSAKTHSP